MKMFPTMLVMVFLAMPAFSQFSIKGNVKDATNGTPLPGANVVIDDTYKGVHTDSQGDFNLEGLTAGTYPLVVSYIGYDDQHLWVEVPDDTQIEVSLERSAILSQEVIVKATRADERTPATKSEVSRDFIRSNNLGQDIPYLLSLTPSLTTSSDAGAGIGYTWMNIRGSDNSRINVTINGIPVNDAESHGVWWVNMPDLASSTDNIQIQRGVGTSTQGAASFGATISVETTKLQEDAYAEVISSAGSFNTLRNTVNLGTGLLRNGFSFDGRLSKSNSDGYIDRSFSDLKSFYLSGGYYGKNTAVKGMVFSGREKTYQAWNGVPGYLLETHRTYNPSGSFYDENGDQRFYENETDNYQQDHYQLHLTHRFGQQLTGNTSFHYTYGRGFYEQYKQGESFEDYGLANAMIDEVEIDETDLVRQKWLDNHFYGLTYSLNYTSLERLQATLGGGYNIYDGDHFGEIIWAGIAKGFDKGHRYYDNNARKQDFNSFLKINYELFNGFYLFADAQYRNVVYDFEGLGVVNEEVVPLEQQAVFHFFNPKTGFSYDINTSNNLYLFLGISNREPVRRDFTESSATSRPRHETLRNLELGYRYTNADFLAGINYYLMDYKDQLILTGEINDVGGFTRTNVEDSYRTGVEIESAYRFLTWLEISANMTISRNKIPEFTEYSDVYDEDWNWMGVDVKEYKNTDIAFSPSVVSAGKLSITPVKNGDISFMAKYVSDQYIDNTMSSERMLDAYLVNDLKLSYVLRNSYFRELELSIAIYNIFDVDYITNAWVYKGIYDNSALGSIEDGYFPQAGRHFLAGLRLKL